ncbi:MAG: efflux RND transporter periplasmic adaptor subunit [Parcubacteria group bacterium]|jgi:RND family efflux transporter MFP subunit
MNKKIFDLIIIGIIIIGAITSFFIWKSLTSRPSFSQDSVKKGNITEVINLTGNVTPQDKANLSFEITGKIEKIYKHTGDTVNQNDILVTMASDDLRAEYNQSVSLAKSAEGILNNYNDLKDREKYKLKALKADDAAKYDKKAQEEQVDAQKSLIGSQEDQVRAAWDNVAAKKALFDQATLRANFSGTVAQTNFDEGEVASAGTPVLTLINNNAFEIEAMATELDIKNIKIGQSGKTKTLENPDKPYDVQVTQIDQVETDTNGVPAYKIKMEILNNDGLRSGMAASVNLETAQKNNVLLAPKDSIFQDGNEKYVWVGFDEKREKRQVKTGIYGSDGMVEIVSGLTEGENILVLNK